MGAPADTVSNGLRSPLADLGVDLEAVDIHQTGRRHVVRVVVDRDGGIDLDLMATVSQRISALLDEPPLADHLPGPFVLEVTSPGVDRPLTEPRHWRRALTRLVHVTMRDGSVVDGRLTAVPSDDEVIVDAGAGERAIALADVDRAAVQVEFNRGRADDEDEE